MTESERAATQQRLRQWDEARPELEEQRWRELMAMTPERALELTRALLGRQGVVTGPRLSSGLVEQQALFHRRRRL